MPLYQGKFKEDLDVEKGAEHLAKFLKSCTEEMKLAAFSLGKTDLSQVNREDLVCVDRDLAWTLGIDYAGFSREDQRAAPDGIHAVPPWMRGGAPGKEAPATRNIH